MQNSMRIRNHATWTNDFLWRCSNHIPTSKTYPFVVEFCPICKTPRPSMELRPSPVADPVETPPVEAPPAKVIPIKPRGKFRCIWPPCENLARDTSPYCGKLCSDRAIRLRRKSEKGTETVEDKANNVTMRARLALWEAR